jgi:hypothetical protein
MTQTATKERVETDAPKLAPEPQLPAIHQEARKPHPPAQPQPARYPGSIARAVIAITRKMEAVAKEGVNQFQNYRYQRWEDISEKLSPLLAEHGLFMLQSEQSRSLLEQNEKGSVLAIVYHFTLVHENGDMAPAVEWTAIQRLRDQKGTTDDKAAAKCHTQAEKYFCIKQFKIRVAEELPHDQHHPKAKCRGIYEQMQREIDAATSVVELATWGKENVKNKKTLPPDWQDFITARYNEKMADLKGEPQVVWDDETGEVHE